MSLRPSTFGGRASHAVNSQANIAAAKAQLAEKKKEYEAVQALERVSAGYLERLQGMGEDFESMADAGQAYGQVLAEWPAMFKILGMFLDSRDRSQPNDEDEVGQVAQEGQRVVRVPLDDLEQQAAMQEQGP